MQVLGQVAPMWGDSGAKAPSVSGSAISSTQLPPSMCFSVSSHGKEKFIKDLCKGFYVLSPSSLTLSGHTQMQGWLGNVIYVAKKKGKLS